MDAPTIADDPIRILMYSHDGLGFGHYRRLLKLAASLGDALPKVAILLITGSSMAHAFRIPSSVDYVKLPCVAKENNDSYTGKSLPLAFKDMRALRERLVLETAVAYRPHVFLVDKLPLGMGGEVLLTLQALKEHVQPTRLVLGIRDILDDSEVMVPYFQDPAVAAALETMYDEIWVYGCQPVFDPIKEYCFTPSIAQKVKFCGYLSCEPPTSPPAAVRRELGIGDHTFVLVTAGAGSDGFPVLDTYLQALDFFPQEREVFSLLISGTDIPPQDRAALHCRLHDPRFSALRQVELLEFSPRMIDYMSAADVVVSMGGYNTLSEVLSLEKQAVVIPRITPRREQLLRAVAFEKHRLIRMLHPDSLTPQSLAETVLEALHPPAIPVGQRRTAAGIELSGLERVKHHLLHLLSIQNEVHHAVL